MTDEQNDELSSFNRVEAFNARYNADLIGILGFPAVKTVFDTALGKIRAGILVQAVDDSGETPEALVLKEKMAKITLKYAKKGRVMSRLALDGPLTARLTHPKSFIYRAPKETAILNATNIRNALNSNLGICTNVLAANIVSIDASITAYSGQKDAAIIAKQTKSALGTALLPDQFAVDRGAVINLFDLIDGEWEDDLVFGARVGEFELAKEIITTGHHDIKAFFTVVADENPLNVLHDADVHDESNGKNYVADDDTYIVHIYHHRSGHYHFKVSAPGRISVDLIADIHKGMNNFTVRLKLI